MLQTNYASSAEQFGPCNFQREEHLQAIDALVDADHGPKLVCLEGEPGSGRSYLLRAAAHRRAGSSSPLVVLEVDLSDVETQGCSPADFVQLLLEQVSERRDKGWIRDLLGCFSPALGFTVFQAVTLRWALDLPALTLILKKALLGMPSDLARPDRSHENQLRVVLRELTEDATVVVHVTGYVPLSKDLLHCLLGEARSSPRIVIAFSTDHGELPLDVINEIESAVRLDVRAWSQTELAVLLQQRFSESTPMSLSDALWRVSGGRQAILGRCLHDMLAEDLLSWDAIEQRYLVRGNEGDLSRSFALADDLFDPLERFLERLDEGPYLRRLLALCALCGDYVPLRDVLGFMGTSRDLSSRLAGHVADGLCGAEGGVDLFCSLESTHPSFRRLQSSIYRFRNRFYPGAILSRLGPTLKPDDPARLLTHLEKRVPPVTRGAATIHLCLARHVSNDAVRQYLLRALGWWVGMESSERLQCMLSRELSTGLLPAERVWMVLVRTDHWPPHRRLALLESYSNHVHGVPLEREAELRVQQSSLLLQLGQQDRALSVARSAYRIMSESHPSYPAIFQVMGEACFMKGRFDLASRLIVRAAYLSQEHGASGDQVGKSFHMVGRCYGELGEPGAALTWYEQAVEAKRQGNVHGHIDNTSHGLSLHEVGGCHFEQGEPGAALTWYEQAVAVKRQGNLHGQVDNTALGESLHMVGKCYGELGEPRAALTWYEQAVEAKRQGNVHGHIDNTSLGLSLHEVGWCHSEQGEPGAALTWYEQAVAVKRQGNVHGRIDNTSLGTSLHAVGMCHGHGGGAAALTWFRQAVEAMRQGNVHGRIDNASLGRSLYQVGWWHDQQGVGVAALKWFQQAVEAMRQGNVHGRIDNTMLGQCLRAVGRCHGKQGEPVAALTCCEQAAEAMRQGNEHGRIDNYWLGVCLSEVGRCHIDQGDPATALMWYEQAAETMGQGNGHRRIWLGLIQRRVGRCRWVLGQRVPALKAFRQAADSMLAAHRLRELDASEARRLAIMLARIGDSTRAREWCLYAGEGSS